MRTLFEVETKGDETTIAGGIALRFQAAPSTYAVQSYSQATPEAEKSYFMGAYDLTFLDALQEFARRVERGNRFDKGGAIIPPQYPVALADAEKREAAMSLAYQLATKFKLSEEVETTAALDNDLAMDGLIRRAREILGRD